jgi:hypothetical protein
MVQKVLFRISEDEALMGICRNDGILYVASLRRIYKLMLKDFSLMSKTRAFFPSPDFHQMNCYDGRIYATATKRNQIWIFDEDLGPKRRVKIAPPHPRKRVRYKHNYNHINSIIRNRGAFYINLNWLTDEQYADSGVLKTDEQFNELDKFKFAWESHDFQIIDGKMMAICSTSGRDKTIRHPNISGLMVEGEVVWQHDPDESFCKAFCTDEKYIYFCGGMKASRAKRKDTAGIIYLIDRKTYRLERKIEQDGLRGIRGAMLLANS